LPESGDRRTAMRTIEVTCWACEAKVSVPLVRHSEGWKSWPLSGDLPVGWHRRPGISKSLHIEVTLYFCSDLCLRRHEAAKELRAH